MCVCFDTCMSQKVLWAWSFFTHNYVDASTSMATSVVSFLAHLADWSLTFRKRWKGWSLHLLRPGGDLETRTQTASKHRDFGGNYIVFICLQIRFYNLPSTIISNSKSMRKNDWTTNWKMKNWDLTNQQWNSNQKQGNSCGFKHQTPTIINFESWYIMAFLAEPRGFCEDMKSCKSGVLVSSNDTINVWVSLIQHGCQYIHVYLYIYNN